MNQYVKNNKAMLIASGLMVISVLSVLLVVFALNQNVFKNRNEDQTQSAEKVTSQPSDEEEQASQTSPLEEVLNPIEEEAEEEAVDVHEAELINTEDADNDDLHTPVLLRSGETYYALISSAVPVNTLNTSQLNISQDGRMQYLNDGKNVASFGVFVSSEQKYVNFNKLVKDDVDFVMIRLGYTGYESGQVELDSYFADNLRAASRSSLGTGVYYESHAITIEEAEEEAAMVLLELENYTIDHPVALHLGYVDNDTSRDENLSKEDRTQVVKAFLEKIEEAGYLTCIYADKEWLITKLNLSQLSDYDILLDQRGGVFNYPYRMHIWKYGKIEVDGIYGEADCMISFINYKEK